MLSVTHRVCSYPPSYCLLSYLQVRQLVIRGTFHAGGFFAPGHLASAHAAMPHITRLVFVQCRDFKPQLLQQVVDSRLSPCIELVHGTNFEHPAEATSSTAAGLQQQGQATSSSAQQGDHGHQGDPSIPGAAGVGGEEALEAAEEGPGSSSAGGFQEEAPGAEAPDEGVEEVDQQGAADFDLPLAEAGDWLHLAVQEVLEHHVHEGDGQAADASWQAKRQRAAQAAQRRKQELQRIVTAAAGVGVQVKLLPAVAWERWYHELLE